MLLGQQLARFVPPRWQGYWLEQIVRYQPHVIERFFAFDAAWYWQIGTQGYAWDAARPLLMQDVAFFPLWPLLVHVVSASGVSPIAAGWMLVAFAAAFGLASVVAFDRLARRLLPPAAAATATWLFALYPAGSFLLLAYPTGLMNLLTVLALLALIEERFVAAAACSALLTAIGPLGLGTALAVVSWAAWRRLLPAGRRALPTIRSVAGVVALGLLCVSGLLAFMLWQQATLGDAFAFMKAQAAWELRMSWLARVPRAALQVLILPDFAQAIGALKHVAHPPSPVWLELALERCLNSIVQGLSFIGLLACLRFAPWPVVLQGAFAEAIFIWFHGAIRPGNSTMRLLYCTIGMFLGAAWLLRNRPGLAATVISLSALLLCGGALLLAAGHHFT